MVWTRHLCRICAQIGDACYPIFDTTSGRNIEIKMRKCFSFLIFRDDYKPKEICNCCYMKLNDLFEFVEMCYTSNSKFETMVFSSNQGLWLEKQTQNYDDCQLNGVIVNSKNNLNEHLSSSNMAMVVDYENSLHLHQTTKEPVCLNMNYGTDLDMRTIEVNKQKTETDNFKTYQCYEQNHTVLRHSSDFYKSLQANPVSNFINLDDNVMNYSNIDNQYNKLIKKEEATSYDIIKGKKGEVLQEDINVESLTLPSKDCSKASRNKKTFTCPHCAKIFMRKNSLNVHLSTHTKIRPFSCDLCSKSFAIERDLRSHKRIHSNIYQCKYCAKSFSVPSKLERHMRIHTNTKPFICPVQHCLKSFSDKCNLEGHKLSHSNEKNFVCDICNKSYKTNSQLKDHKKSHSDSTPYKCQHCGKMYKWKTNLTVHMKKHEGYKCIRCNKDCHKLCKLFKHRKSCKVGL
ncbi:zinc-finger associated domain containing protein [Oryctes borbonicus]|uniref:Zinc-finger associated domain containing protein n=1 Tax=Oryctes borbonicus TaxID=1629725 RepID=A0A0T6AVV9_9SCAR|nr:zinc-finger associated domain containing protein [Oryctes borbonicus]